MVLKHRTAGFKPAATLALTVDALNIFIPKGFSHSRHGLIMVFEAPAANVFSRHGAGAAETKAGPFCRTGAGSKPSTVYRVDGVNPTL